MKKMVFLFIDGLGIGQQTEHNPLLDIELSLLRHLIHDESKPIDACLGIPGTPQSATGQTSLFCGINAQRSIGRHEEGFPGSRLREIIAQENIYMKLKRLGKSGTFANGYWLNDIHNLDKKLRRKKSVTTVAALSGLGGVRTMEYLEQGKAVYQDITQELLIEKGAPLPLLTEVEAAGRLHGIAKEFDFTLFEYFQTDLAAHSRDPVRVFRILKRLQNFIEGLMDRMDFTKEGLLVTSDHGNIEDLSRSGHTQNPVPCFYKGPDKAFLLDRIEDISQITPAILSWFQQA